MSLYGTLAQWLERKPDKLEVDRFDSVMSYHMGTATRPDETVGRLAGKTRVRIPWVSTMKQMLVEDYIAYPAGYASANLAFGAICRIRLAA